jgi:hypothetical protein
MNAVIISHRFNPGHLWHLAASFKLLIEAGFDARFFWNPKFSSFAEGKYDQVLTNRSDLLRLNKGDLVLVWFPSMTALLDMLLVRIFSKATVIYVLHEPFSSIRSYRESGFGWLKTLKIALISIVNYALVACAHRVVLPSTAAFAAYRGRYSKTKPSALFPLMFDDVATTILPVEMREFVSYIGTVAEDHAFDQFLKYACWYMDANPNDRRIRFLIATRSALSQEIRQQLSPYTDKGLLFIQSGRSLTNVEIGNYYARSLVVWNAYRRSMQSGVLPNAYMYGTPVLITRLTRNEYFIDRVTGVEIETDYDANQIKAAIDIITTNFYEYSKACRRIFLDSFFYRSFAPKFIKFVCAESH